jgi:hypothetical protein
MGKDTISCKLAAACEPIKNKGVASPPLKPKPKLIDVAINFKKANDEGPS